MSGGSLDYFYCNLEEHVGDFKDKELDALVKDLAQLFHDREWYLSGDTGEGDWNDARDKFKAKWFTQHGRQERIEQYIAELTEDIRRSFGISTRYCFYCKHWEQSKDYDWLGDCPYNKGCFMHRSEYCEKFERREQE